MFTYISIEEFADGVVKNNKDTNRKELIASLREALAAKRSGARCMICGAPIWKVHDLRRAHLGGRQRRHGDVPVLHLHHRRGRRQRGLRDRINEQARSISLRACCVIWRF